MSTHRSASLRPEQSAALDFIRRHGSEADLQSIRSILERTFRALDALLAAVDGDEARRKPEPAIWSVHEVADHLAVSHEPVLEQLAALLRQETPTGGAVPVGLQSEDPFALSWPAQRQRLGEVHARVLELLAAADDDIPLTAQAPVAMAVRCATAEGGSEWVEWEQSFDWKAVAVILSGHVREHIRQLRRLL